MFLENTSLVPLILRTRVLDVIGSRNVFAATGAIVCQPVNVPYDAIFVSISQNNSAYEFVFRIVDSLDIPDSDRRRLLLFGGLNQCPPT